MRCDWRCRKAWLSCRTRKDQVLTNGSRNASARALRNEANWRLHNSNLVLLAADRPCVSTIQRLPPNLSRNPRRKIRCRYAIHYLAQLRDRQCVRHLGTWSSGRNVCLSLVLGTTWNDDHWCFDHDDLFLLLYAGSERVSEFGLQLRNLLLLGMFSHLRKWTGN